jgi:hypothetical protein
MAQFLSIRLRALGLAVDHPITCSDWWGTMAEEALAAEGIPYEQWDEAQIRCAPSSPWFRRKLLF